MLTFPAYAEKRKQSRKLVKFVLFGRPWLCPVFQVQRKAVLNEVYIGWPYTIKVIHFNPQWWSPAHARGHCVKTALGKQTKSETVWKQEQVVTDTKLLNVFTYWEDNNFCY